MFFTEGINRIVDGTADLFSPPPSPPTSSDGSPVSSKAALTRFTTLLVITFGLSFYNT